MATQIVTWFLIFTVVDGSNPFSFDGGEYQTIERCRAAALMQMPHWRRYYATTAITWKCSLTIPKELETDGIERKK